MCTLYSKQDKHNTVLFSLHAYCLQLPSPFEFLQKLLTYPCRSLAFFACFLTHMGEQIVIVMQRLKQSSAFVSLRCLVFSDVHYRNMIMKLYLSQLLQLCRAFELFLASQSPEESDPQTVHTFCRQSLFHQRKDLGTCCSLLPVLKSPCFNKSIWVDTSDLSGVLSLGTLILTVNQVPIILSDLECLPGLGIYKQGADPSLHALLHRLPHSATT